MKIDLTKVFFNEDGEDYEFLIFLGKGPDGNGLEKREKATFNKVITKALLTEFKGEEEKVEGKGERFTLWYEKIKDKKTAELTLEEGVMIKERVGKLFGAIIYGQIAMVIK